MALSEAQIRVTVTADVAPLSALSQQMAVASTSADKMGASFVYVGESAAKAEAGMAPLAASTDRVGASAGRAGLGMGSFQSQMGAARVEMGALEGSTGMMASGLARVAAQSSLLGPLIQAAFVPVAAVAFGAIIADIGKKTYDLYENVILLKGSIAELDKADSAEATRAASLNYEYEEAIGRRLERQGDLTAAAEAYRKAEGDKPLELPKLDDKISKQFNADFLSFLQAVHTTSEAPTVLTRIGAEAASVQGQLDKASEKLVALKQDLASHPGDEDVKGAIMGEGGPFERTTALITDLTAKMNLLKGAIGEVQSQTGISSERMVETTVSLADKALKKQEEAGRTAEEQQKKLNEQYKQSWELLERQEKAVAKMQAGWDKTYAAELDALDAESVAVAKFGAQSYVADAKSQLDSFEAMARDQISKVEGEISTAEAKASTKERGISSAQYLTEPQKRTAEKDVLAEQLATEQAAILPLIANLEAEKVAVQQSALSDEAKATAIEKLNAQIDALNNKLLPLKAKMDELAQDNWPVQLGNKVHTAFASMDSTINSSLQEWVARHRTFGQAMYQIWDGIAQKAIMNLLRVTEKTLEQLAIQKVMHIATDQAVVASHGAAAVESAAISKTNAFTEQLAYAKVAAAKAYSAFANIPVVGPELGAVAAAATFAAVLAFHEGGIAPYETPAVLLRDEMVLDPDLSRFVRESAARAPALAGGGDDARGGDQHIHFSALDSRSFQDFFHRNSTQIMRQVRQMHRNGMRLR